MKPRKTDIGIGLLTLGSFLRLIFPEEGAGKHCQHDLRIGRGGAVCEGLSGFQHQQLFSVSDKSSWESLFVQNSKLNL